MEQEEKKTVPARSAREIEVKRKMEERTGGEERKRESDSKREEEWQAYWCYRDQQRACRMAQVSAKKIEHTGHA